MVEPIYDTNFAQTLSKAMDEFQEALTKRWRETYIEAVTNISYDFPVVIQRPVSPTMAQLWETHTAAARQHIGRNYCKYVDWVEGGQEGSLSDVHCDGKTGASEPVEIAGLPADGGGMVTVPPNIDCGVGGNLELIDQWSRGERDNIYYKLPFFDKHDLHKLEDAHDDFIRMAKRMGLTPSKKSQSEPSVGHFPELEDRDLVTHVQDASSERSEGKDFWAGWTGLAASRAGNGFFASVSPTLNNQSIIVGALANLYAKRAAIIMKGRNDALYWSQWGAKSCDDKVTVTTDHRDGWATVTGIGDAILLTGGFSPVGATVGAAFVLTGFLGSEFLPKTSHEEYAHSVEEIVNKVNSQVDDLNKELTKQEGDYTKSVNDFQGELNNVNSFNLELYDLTQNNASGDGAGDPGSYSANVDDILRIGEACYEAGDAYNDLLPILSGTSGADGDLADKDGKASTGDKAVLDVREQLKGFLSTTTGRYVVAGNETKAAAREYSKTDQDQAEAFRRVMTDWDDLGVGDVDVHGDGSAEDEAEATDRGDYGKGDPGERAHDGEDYVID